MVERLQLGVELAKPPWDLRLDTRSLRTSLRREYPPLLPEQYYQLLVLEIDRLLNVIDRILEHLDAQHKTLDVMQQRLFGAISDRHLVGDLADRPDPDEAGMTFLATDQTPEEYHVADGDNWHQFDSV